MCAMCDVRCVRCFDASMLGLVRGRALTIDYECMIQRDPEPLRMPFVNSCGCGVNEKKSRDKKNLYIVSHIDTRASCGKE